MGEYGEKLPESPKSIQLRCGDFHLTPRIYQTLGE